MKYRTRIQYTASQKAQMWDRWQQGESLHQIARLFDRGHSSVQRILAESGGIRPPARRRSERVLNLAEREEISRGLVSGQSIRSIAASLGRAPSTVSREVAETKGRPVTVPATPTRPRGTGRVVRSLVSWHCIERCLAASPTSSSGSGLRSRSPVVEAHLSGRYEQSGVTRDDLPHPLHPVPRRPEKGAAGAPATYAGDASFGPPHAENRRPRSHQRHRIDQRASGGG